MSLEAKRVLMVVQNCPYLRDPRVRNEAKTLIAAGYQVSVVCPGRSGEPWYESIEAVDVYRFPSWSPANNVWGYLTEYIFAMVSIAVLSVLVLSRDGFDIIHVANPPDCIVPIIGIYKLLGKSVVYDQHELCPELFAAKFGGSWFPRGLLFLLERYSYQIADQVVVTNDSYKEIAMQRGGRPESKVTVVRNGPSLPDFSIRDVDPVLRAKAPNIIAFAGVTGVQDGLDYLCQALHHLCYGLGQKDFYCIILGDGDALDGVKALARELRVEDKVWFAGWVSDPDLYARYISTADICVVPDSYNDYNNRSTFVKVMEYMAARKPIVAFDLLETRRSAGAAASYARVNDAADFAQKLADLIANPSLRYSMGESGYLRVQSELAWEYSVPKLLSVYEKVGRSSLTTQPVSATEIPAESRSCTRAENVKS
jgi:glycosyltransferase involved in cell wall biosynthesis